MKFSIRRFAETQFYGGNSCNADDCGCERVIDGRSDAVSSRHFIKR